MTVLGEKLDGRPADHSAGLEVVSGEIVVDFYCRKAGFLRKLLQPVW
jgi:hypothetical protein